MPLTTYQVNPNGAVPQTANLADVHQILVEYDSTSGGVTVNPGQVDNGKTVRFKDPKGGKLRVVFLSPEGNETDTVLDGDSCTMIIAGIYRFLCFFTPPEATTEIAAKTVGVLEVYPHRPFSHPPQPLIAERVISIRKFIRIRERNQITLPAEIISGMAVRAGDFLEIGRTSEGSVYLKPTILVPVGSAEAKREEALAEDDIASGSYETFGSAEEAIKYLQSKDTAKFAKRETAVRAEHWQQRKR
ncbi:MAG TPA: AbrB/MazE/SpoVT family DNA-binding domain-containing protein [Candidatus Angelobacter sp.]